MKIDGAITRIKADCLFAIQWNLVLIKVLFIELKLNRIIPLLSRIEAYVNIITMFANINSLGYICILSASS